MIATAAPMPPALVPLPSIDLTAQEYGALRRSVVDQLLHPATPLAARHEVYSRAFTGERLDAGEVRRVIRRHLADRERPENLLRASSYHATGVAVVSHNLDGEVDSIWLRADGRWKVGGFPTLGARGTFNKAVISVSLAGFLSRRLSGFWAPDTLALGQSLVEKYCREGGCVRSQEPASPLDVIDAAAEVAWMSTTNPTERRTLPEEAVSLFRHAHDLAEQLLIEQWSEVEILATRLVQTGCVPGESFETAIGERGRSLSLLR